MTNSAKTLFALLACVGTGLSAQAKDIDMNTARLQAMDKITGRVSEVIVPVNGLANYGTFSILVRKCVTKSAEEIPENTAFVDVVDNYKSAHPVNIFKGWMFSSTPALNAVEHPIYDIWLLECYNKKHDPKALLTSEQLALRDAIELKRHEKISVSTTLTDVKEDEAPSQKTFSQETNEITETTEEDGQFASEGEEFETETAPEDSSVSEDSESSETSQTDVIIIKE